MTDTQSELGIVGTVARFKPLHRGHAAVIETLCEKAKHVYIGIGSCNRYNVRNPLTAKESAEMIEIVLKPKYDNYTILEVPDLDNGPRWREQILKIFPPLDYFITANNYVKSLLEKDYKIIHPASIIPGPKKFPVTGTMVRVAIAKGLQWEHLVPETIADYIKQKKLDDRFCKEFGLETLAQNAFEIIEEVSAK